MSRYPPSDYRGPRDRSRSPPRFSDRRGSAAAIFDSRAPGLPRASDAAQRGPRFDGALPRPPPPPSNLGPGNGPRPGYTSLRDAPPLGSGDRGRPFRERDFDRRDRLPSPRERSPPRNFKDTYFRDDKGVVTPTGGLRDYPPRDLDIPRARRDSRDGPPSASSTFSDAPPFAATPARGGFGGRGRGRGDYDSFRGGRGGRRHFDDRDLFRRERSPPPPAAQRWSRDAVRDPREADRRDDRRPLERRDDDRRPDWVDRERDVDRARRDLPSSRLEARHSNESVASGPSVPSAPQALPIDPGRLAMLEQSGADVSVKRQSAAQNAAPPPREGRRDVPEMPSYLNGRAETMANRYNQRGSSPPAHAAPAVPAFTLSFAPSGPSKSASATTAEVQAPKPSQEPRSIRAPSQEQVVSPASYPSDSRSQPPVETPAAPRPPPPAPKVGPADPPPSAPKAPRALDTELPGAFGSRLQGVKSLDNFNGPTSNVNPPSAPRADVFTKPSPTGPKAASPAPPPPPFPTLTQPISPSMQTTRFGDQLSAPTGPRASRVSPAQVSAAPRPPFTSPRSDAGSFHGFPAAPRRQTPPPTAPSGPRNRSFSVSPKVSSSTIPTAPKGIRAPPTAPRAGERGATGIGRGQDRLGAPAWAPPTAPRGLQAPQWNQWRRTGAPTWSEKIVPAKRDFMGEEKDRQLQNGARGPAQSGSEGKFGADTTRPPDALLSAGMRESSDRMDVDRPSTGQQPRQSQASSHSAAQSFFGKPVDKAEEEPSISDAAEEPMSSSEEEEIDLEEDLALFNAKFERQKRALEADMADLSTREYRATTPSESIARLSRISESDLQRLREQHEQQEQHQSTEMEIDEAPAPEPVKGPAAAPSAADKRQLAPPTTRSSRSDDGPDVLTPQGDKELGVEIRNSEDELRQVHRERRKPSPEIISLPYLLKDAQPFHESEALLQTLTRQQETRPEVFASLQEEVKYDDEFEEQNERQFRDLYRTWRRTCEDYDREREEQEKQERQQSAEPGPEMEPPPAPPVNSATEGRRLHKFSSEYEIEQVLKQSEETARIEQERQDRETKKLQADMEKEAVVSDQQPKEKFMRGAFIDANRFRAPEKLTMAFSFQPQPDTFTEEEQRIFIAAFKETPKRWGEIASLLLNRTYKDCIHHYYTNKWDGRFRDNRFRKGKGTGRRGRGGKGLLRGKGSAAMADLSRTEELAPPNVSESGRPKRAAAPTTFGEKEVEAKNALTNPSPAKKPGPGGKQDGNGDAGPEKPGKRRKGVGEKPGRKPKAQQPLAALAAAPTAAQNKSFSQHQIPSKEELARAQSIEDAALLTGFQSGQLGSNSQPGQHGMVAHEPQMVYHHHESFVPTVPIQEEPAPSKATVQTPSSKTSASSYWSVPEQTDFAKYIAHFGTDFAAIAAHMGTKTQTMIKNHYQRQIDSGNRPELQQQALEADRRRDAGEDLGPPPTPTPIVKRKYDNPQPTVSAPRPLAPHVDSMEIDEPPPQPRGPPPPKHVSPAQYQAQPRFSASAQATPVPASRVVPSPGSTTASPATSQVQPQASARQMQHPLGQRLSFLPETRPESRPGMPTTSSFRLSQENLTRKQPAKNSPVPDPQYIHNLMQEQQRALQMQEQQSQQERMEIQRQGSLQRNSLQGSPATQPLPQPPPERKPLFEDRASTPPRNLLGQSSLARPPFSQTPFAPLGSAALSGSLLGRSAFNPTPPLRDETPRQDPLRQELRQEGRPSSVPALQPVQQSMSTAPPAPVEPPKRSNLMSILNADADDSKAIKKDAAPSAPQRAASPAPAFQSSATPGPQPNAQLSQRRETFGQPPIGQPLFGRSSFGQTSQTPAPQPPPVKQEPTSTPLGQPPKPDWANHVLGRGQPVPPQSQAMSGEKDGRQYFPHRASAFGGLNQPTRANPSPPPHAVMGHSRTPSLTTQPHQPPPREQHPAFQSQSMPGSRGPVQPLHANPYAQPPAGTPFSQPPVQQIQNHAHHAHNGSVSAGFPGMHHRAPSHGEIARHEQMVAVQRERDDFEMRRMHEQRDFERHHRDAQFHAQRQHQHQMEQDRQQQAFARGPPGPPPQQMHPGFGHPPPFAQPRASLRDQAMRDAEAALQEEQERRRSHAMHQQQHQQQQHQQQHQQHQDDERRRFEMEVQQREREFEYMRRQGEPVFRRTPLGGGYGPPPPPPPPRR